MSLAAKHRFSQIDVLMTQYAGHLLNNKKTFQAIELFRKARKHAEAGKLLFQLARQGLASFSNPLQVKKLFVLAGKEVNSKEAVGYLFFFLFIPLQIQEHRKKLLDVHLSSAAGAASQATLTSLTSSFESESILCSFSHSKVKLLHSRH